MTYSADDVKLLLKELESIENRRRRLLLTSWKLNFIDPEAKRYHFEGSHRRLRHISSSIKELFEAIPPDTVRPPPTDKLHRATLCIHANVINTFGYLDCLARAWVIEKR